MVSPVSSTPPTGPEIKFYKSYGLSGDSTAEITLPSAARATAQKAKEVFSQVKAAIVKSHLQGRDAPSDEQLARFQFSLNFDQPHLSYLMDTSKTPPKKIPIDLTDAKYHSMAIRGEKVHELVTSTAEGLRAAIPFTRATVDVIGRTKGEEGVKHALSRKVTKVASAEFKDWAPVLTKIAPKDKAQREEFLQQMSHAVHVNQAQIEMYQGRLSKIKDPASKIVEKTKELEDKRAELDELEKSSSTVATAGASSSAPSKDDLEAEIQAIETELDALNTEQEEYTQLKSQVKAAQDIDWLAVGLGFICKSPKEIEQKLSDSKLQKDLSATIPRFRFKFYEKIDREAIKEYALDVAALHKDSLLEKHELYKEAGKDLKVGSPVLDLLIRASKIKQTSPRTAKEAIDRFSHVAELSKDAQKQARNLFADGTIGVDAEQEDISGATHPDVIFVNALIIQQDHQVSNIEDDKEFQKALEGITTKASGVTVSDAHSSDPSIIRADFLDGIVASDDGSSHVDSHHPQ